jgi:hypothetical protein
MRIKHDGGMAMVRHEGRIGKDPRSQERPRVAPAVRSQESLPRRKPDFHGLQL